MRPAAPALVAQVRLACRARVGGGCVTIVFSDHVLGEVLEGSMSWLFSPAC